jgi:hypothetical protein
MKPLAQCVAVACACICCVQHAYAAEVSGTLRATPEWHTANDRSVLAPAAARLGSADDLVATDLELRASAGPVAGIATLRHVAAEHRGPEQSAILNELHASTDLAGWYFTVGKKIVSWDVGYAFRPLDVIQQEDRRRLLSTTLEGVPVFVVERFHGDAAWSVVIANPGKSSQQLGRDEPAIATRAYWRDGAADWHAVARYGERTGWRLGTGVAWVATESLEFHASALYSERLEHVVGSDGPLQVPLYNVGVGSDGWQALAGASWTGRSRVSVLLEIWHDERAWSEQEWREWRATTQYLGDTVPIPALRQRAVASQAGALGVASLHRDNALLRVAWSGDAFYPSADVLYTPADGGAVATARLEWRGARSAIEVGWRHCLGPATSMVKQLPFSAVIFVSAGVSF